MDPHVVRREIMHLYYGGVDNAEELLSRQPFPGCAPVHTSSGWPIVHTFPNALSSAQHSRAMAHEVRQKGGDLYKGRAGHSYVNSVTRERWLMRC